MQGDGAEDLPEFTPWIETALVLVGSIMHLVEHLLGIAMRSLCAAAVIDLEAYLRGQ